MSYSGPTVTLAAHLAAEVARGLGLQVWHCCAQPPDEPPERFHACYMAFASTATYPRPTYEARRDGDPTLPLERRAALEAHGWTWNAWRDRWDWG